LRDSDKMQAEAGFCFTQIQSAAMTIETQTGKFFKMSEEEFEK